MGALIPALIPSVAVPQGGGSGERRPVPPSPVKIVTKRYPLNAAPLSTVSGFVRYCFSIRCGFKGGGGIQGAGGVWKAT